MNKTNADYLINKIEEVISLIETNKHMAVAKLLSIISLLKTETKIEAYKMKATKISEIKRLKYELLMVSKLASDKPEFFNPINAGMAKLIRDRVLKNNLKEKNKDGK